MPIFSQPKSGQPNPFEEQQKVINEIIRRVNDIDRRVRLNEQANLNQKQTIDNMNENFVKLRGEVMDRIKNVESKAGLDKIDSIERSLKDVKGKIDAMPSRAEIAKMRSFIATAMPSTGSELDDALAALEMLIGKVKKERKEPEKGEKEEPDKKEDKKGEEKGENRE